MQKPDKDRILIFGKGQIGSMYFDYFKRSGYEVSLADADVTKIEEVERAINAFSPSVVINTAGKTNLEWCDNNKLEAFNVNVLGAGNIAEVCEERGIYFIHFSSGCIFESDSSEDVKTEGSIPNPAAYYSWTKVWSENIVSSRKNLKYLILRPRQPVSSEVSDKNMLIKMLTFSKFVGDDGGWNSGTVLEDLMEITQKLIGMRVTGILNVANDGWTTPYKIGLMLKKYINPSMQITEIAHRDLDKVTPVKRVAVVLGISRLKSLGITPENYEKRLEEIIKDLKTKLKGKTAEEVLKKAEETSKQRTTVSEDWKKVFSPAD
jgi:3,5-epimerase/4-reductase